MYIMDARVGQTGGTYHVGGKREQDERHGGESTDWPDMTTVCVKNQPARGRTD